MTLVLKTTAIADVAGIVSASRAVFNKGLTRSVEHRKTSLRSLALMLKDNEARWAAALAADLRKSKTESAITEIGMVRNECYEFLDNLDAWMKPEAVHKDGVQKLDGAHIHRDPLGVLLIIGAWNYPIQVTLHPAVAALAGGNTVVLKPSELAEHTANLMAELVPKYFPDGTMTVINGGVDVNTEVLRLRYDHIVYTGGSFVAKIVMAAAAKHLTPVTLELGGKSPCVVDQTANIPVAARRIMWGRLVNAGQTCIAPDYILVHHSVKAALITALAAARTDFLGADPKASPDYARIINDRHYDRVTKLLSGGRIVVGGEVDAKERFIAPTVLDDVDLASPLMQDEIFGPLLPLVPYRDADQVPAFINAREKPLAMYIFSDDKAFVHRLLTETTAGGVTVNDCLMHVSCAGLPFGGVGNSGMGAYHGKHGFLAFTHAKSVYKRVSGMEAPNAIRYPPYSDRKLSIISSLMMRSGEANPWVRRVWYATLLAVAATLLRFAWLKVGHQ